MWINTDSQIVINAVEGKITVPRDIINLVEDIKGLCLFCKDFVLEIVEVIIRKLMS